MNFRTTQLWLMFLLGLSILWLVVYTSRAHANSLAGQWPALGGVARGLKFNARSATAGPVIDVWYGNYQVFGQIGVPQQWVNILGNVSDPDGVDTLVYALNGGAAAPLSMGPDRARLEAEGDFNIEIDYQDLLPGTNQVVITATDQLANQAVVTVTVEWVGNRVWSAQPYTIDWTSVTTITEVAQIVDGQWIIENDTVRTAVMGYDRLIAIGDISWEDFEVVVPITIYATTSSNEGGVGVILRWQGHFQESTEQPRTGWWNLGAYGYYRYRDTGNHLALRLGQADPAKNYDVQLDFGTTYIFKMRVTGSSGMYQLKVWEQGQPEPADWDMTAVDTHDIPNGSLLLAAHKADASFGSVTIQPLKFELFLPLVLR